MTGKWYGEWSASVFIRNDGQVGNHARYVVIRDDTGEDVSDTPLSKYFTITHHAGENGLNGLIKISLHTGAHAAWGTYRFYAADSEGNLSAEYAVFRLDDEGPCLILGGMSPLPKVSEKGEGDEYWVYKSGAMRRLP